MNDEWRRETPPAFVGADSRRRLCWAHSVCPASDLETFHLRDCLAALSRCGNGERRAINDQRAHDLQFASSGRRRPENCTGWARDTHHVVRALRGTRTPSPESRRRPRGSPRRVRPSAGVDWVNPSPAPAHTKRQSPRCRQSRRRRTKQSCPAHTASPPRREPSDWLRRTGARASRGHHSRSTRRLIAVP